MPPCHMLRRLDDILSCRHTLLRAAASPPCYAYYAPIRRFDDYAIADAADVSLRCHDITLAAADTPPLLTPCHFAVYFRGYAMPYARFFADYYCRTMPLFLRYARHIVAAIFDAA